MPKRAHFSEAATDMMDVSKALSGPFENLRAYIRVCMFGLGSRRRGDRNV
jgi:hypothetical protein